MIATLAVTGVGRCVEKVLISDILGLHCFYMVLFGLTSTFITGTLLGHSLYIDITNSVRSSESNGY
jgi:hypothetical protein